MKLEITKSYPVNRIMYVRPCTEIARAAIELYGNHSGLELFARILGVLKGNLQQLLAGSSEAS